MMKLPEIFSLMVLLAVLSAAAARPGEAAPADSAQTSSVEADVAPEKPPEASASAVPENSGSDDFVMPVVIDKKAPKSYIEKMLDRLDEFQKELQLKEKYLIVQDDISDFVKNYNEFQKKAHIEIHGSLKNESALQLYEPGRVNKLVNQLYLSGKGELSPSVKYFVSGRYRYDSVFDVNQHYSGSVETDMRSELELRDTYLDISAGDFDFRLGKQQVVWGEAVGLFYADVVNTKDLREYILPDFDFIRIPEWGASGEYTKDKFHTQIVVLPGEEFDRLGGPTSNFYVPPPLPVLAPFTVQDPKEPKHSFENAKVGTKFSYLYNGLDVGTFYLRTWTETPVMYRTIDLGVYNYDPRYERQNIFGATFSKEIEDYVCKGEAVYYPGAYFPVSDASDSDGIRKTGYLDYLIGVDHTFFGRWDVNVQFTQRWFPDYEKTMIGQKKISNGFSLRLAREWFSKKLSTEMLAIVNFDGPDYLYRPRISYNLTSNLKASVGADIFAGDSLGPYGYFRSQSRWYSEMTLKF